MTKNSSPSPFALPAQLCRLLPVIFILLLCHPFGCVPREKDPAASRGTLLQLVSPQDTVIPDGRVVVPFELLRGFPLVHVRIGDHGPYRFLLDTGTPGLMLDSRIARHLPVSSANHPFNAYGKTIRARLRRVKSISVGSVEFCNIEAYELDLRVMSKLKLGKVDGVLGIGVFRQCRLTIDYPTTKIVLETPTQPSTSVADEAPGLRMRRLHACTLAVPLIINKGTVWCMIDSGSAGALAVPEVLARILPLSPPANVSPGSQTMTFLGPIPNRVSKLKATAFIGECAVKDPVVWIQSGMPKIGSEILRQFVVTIDQPRMTARFEPARHQ